MTLCPKERKTIQIYMIYIVNDNGVFMGEHLCIFLFGFVFRAPPPIVVKNGVIGSSKDSY
jgi:hypothetical protein